jgi:hypothetical protein
MANVQTRNELGQFVKGAMPHNKKYNDCVCIISGCERTDIKGHGLCCKHYCLKLQREKNGVFNSDLSKRLPRTEEHKRNNILYTRNPGFVSKLKGKTYKEIYGDKVDKYVELRRGKNNGCWKGGLSFEKYPRIFKNEMRSKIRERDNYTCQECGLKEVDCGRNLDIHHIDFNKKNNSEENLISLCKRCHGNTQRDRNSWTKYYKEKMEVRI